MAAPGYFPLLVEGSWGPNPPKNLSTKLQMYFQSPKKSGGGECEVRQEPGSPGRFLVLFYPEDGEGRAGTARLSPSPRADLGGPEARSGVGGLPGSGGSGGAGRGGVAQWPGGARGSRGRGWRRCASAPLRF